MASLNDVLMHAYRFHSNTMTTSNGGYMHPQNPGAPAAPLPPWLSSSSSSPSVTLTLCPSSSSSWLQHQQPDSASLTLGGGSILQPSSDHQTTNNSLVSQLSECCRELEEGHRAWSSYKKESAWGLKRLELQLESEKARRRREKIEEVEAKITALREEQKLGLERIDGEYREQLIGLRRDAEAKEQKLAEQWAAKHARLTKFLDQMGCRPPRLADPTGR